MADGVVADAEMSGALRATGDCLADLGYAGSAVPVDPQRGFAGGWTFDVEDSAPARDALGVCRAATVADLELAYLAAQAPSAADRAAWEERLRGCLQEHGYVVNGVELGELFRTVDPDEMVACAATARSAPSSP
jgi:hypothetical protein